MGRERNAMNTVADIIEFWNAYFARENESAYYDDSVRVKGAAMIADDPEYWADNSMRKLLERASE